MDEAADALLRRPFDHYGRYRLAADVVTALRSQRGRLRVLDVGGGPGSLAAFLPADDVVSLDVVVPDGWFSTAPDLVVADGSALPFADAAFDVVVSLDTLEHVPGAKRPAVLTEVLRVARGHALVVCPCATPGVPEADAALREYVRARFGDDFPTVTILDEHLGYGHPDPDAVVGTLEAAGAEVRRFGSGRLDRWAPMMVLFFHLLGLADDEPVEQVMRWYNATLYRDDLRDPAYRQAFLAAKPGAAGPPLDEVLAAVLPSGPSPAPDVPALELVQACLTQPVLLQLEEAERLKLVALGQLDGERAAHTATGAEVERLTAELEATTLRADAAETHAAALAAFRDQVINHPAFKARRKMLDLLGRRGPEPDRQLRQ